MSEHAKFSVYLPEKGVIPVSTSIVPVRRKADLDIAAFLYTYQYDLYTHRRVV